MLKKRTKQVVLWIFLFITFGLLLKMVLSLTVVPKTPASIDQMVSILTANGYRPQDTTSQYQTMDSGLIQSIGVQKEDIRFEFFVCKTEDDATNAFSQFYSLIFNTQMSFPNSEYKKATANYYIYTLTASGTFNIAAYVGPTVVYATCNEENAAEISKIMLAIHYFDNSHTNDAFVRLLVILFLVLIDWLCCRWLWYIICQSKGLDKRKIQKFLKEHHMWSSAHKRFYRWLMIYSKHAKIIQVSFIVYQVFSAIRWICLVLAVIGCYTNATDNIITYLVNFILVKVFVTALAAIVNLIFDGKIREQNKS